MENQIQVFAAETVENFFEIRIQLINDDENRIPFQGKYFSLNDFYSKSLNQTVYIFAEIENSHFNDNNKKEVKTLREFLAILDSKNLEETSDIKFKYLFILKFKNIKFEVAINNDSYEFSEIIFENCEILNFNFEIINLERSFGKLVFNNKCDFIKKLHFQNIHFNKLVEFNNCTFKDLVVFDRCNFENNVVFTNSTFEKNILFPYTTFEKTGIFSRTKFLNKSGIDLSQSIINGSLTFFGSDLEDYRGELILSTDVYYENLTIGNHDVSINGKLPLLGIPIENKIETFRILKHQAKNLENTVDFLKFSRLEKIGLKELYKKKFKKNIWNYFILKANECSNNHNQSFTRGILFTWFWGIFFSQLSLNASDKYEWSIPTWEGCKLLIENTINLILPLEGPIIEDDVWYLLLFSAGKISTSYGIYQTIQAFRKFR